MVKDIGKIITEKILHVCAGLMGSLFKNTTVKIGHQIFFAYGANLFRIFLSVLTIILNTFHYKKRFSTMLKEEKPQ